jgi:TonB family protein
LASLTFVWIYTTLTAYGEPVKNNKTTLFQNHILVIHGHVTDKDGAPIKDAILKIKWSEGKWMTNADGEFTLNGNIGDTVIVKHSDYQTSEFVIEKSKTNYFLSLETVEVPVLKPFAVRSGAWLRNAFGTVMDENGKPLSQASIVIEEMRLGITTGPAGNFEIDSIPSDSKLNISHVGYAPLEFVLPKDSNGDTIILKKVITTLNEIVILNNVGKDEKPKPGNDENIKNNHSPTITSVYEAQFPGGQDSLYKYVTQNLIYPPDAVTKQIQGKMLVAFTIAENGSVTSLRVINGFNEAVNQQTLKILSEMPEWQSATQGIKDVATDFILPLHFYLE